MEYYVYKFIGKNNETLYVGQTIDMDRRMMEHKGRIWDDEKDHIEYAKCNNQTDMCIYEMYYINKLKAIYNESLVYDEEPTFELPELTFKIYDEKIVDKIRQEVLNNARADFTERFSPENYWQNKKEKLEEILLTLKKDSDEYKKTIEKINDCEKQIEEKDDTR